MTIFGRLAARLAPRRKATHTAPAARTAPAVRTAPAAIGTYGGKLPAPDVWETWTDGRDPRPHRTR